MIYQRLIRKRVVDALADTRVVHLSGARQVGKSTLAQSIADNEHPAGFLSLDDQATRSLALSDPDGFVAGLETPVVIDEIQRAPELLLSIKRSVDRDPTPGRFLLTGSANLLSLRSVADALTGRIETIVMRPLSVGEQSNGTPINLIDYLFRKGEPLKVSGPVGFDAYRHLIESGGYPEVFTRQPDRRAKWFSNYLNTTILRDLTELSDSHKLDEVPRLTRLLAAQDANLFSANEVAKKLGLNRRTVDRYVALLETTFIVERLRAWKANLGNREVSRPKIHFADTGLLASLLGVRHSGAGIREDLRGPLFETFVVNEFRKFTDWSEADVELFHYRDQRSEVDLVLERSDGSVIPVEIKATASYHPNDIKGIEMLKKRLGDRFVCGLLVYAGERTLQVADRVWAIPAHQLWQ